MNISISKLKNNKNFYLTVINVFSAVFLVRFLKRYLLLFQVYRFLMVTLAPFLGT